MPNTAIGDTTAWWREVSRHFIANPHKDFDSYEPFYVVDFGRVMVQMAKFKKHLPMVHPYYAVKCNNNEALIAMISALGGYFDCASQAEIKVVVDKQYAQPDQVIFANPCKALGCMRTAEAKGVRHVTFDNIDELEKLAVYMPSCKAVLRIKTNDQNAVCAFSTKFGASMVDAPELLERAKQLGVQVVGVSFHVGSGNNDPNAYMGSIMNARAIFDQGNALGFEMKLLDLGGGWPGTDPKVDANGKTHELGFEEICAHIRPLLEQQFDGATIIAEPGRYFSAASHMLSINVHSKRKVPIGESGEQEYQYYVNDGLYHSFNCIVFDHAHPELHLVEPDEDAATHVSTIYGPTCDSLDCILKRQMFPEMNIGDWIFVPDFGSYTTSGGCPFNGFATRRMEFIQSVPGLEL